MLYRLISRLDGVFYRLELIQNQFESIKASNERTLGKLSYPLFIDENCVDLKITTG